MLEPPALLRILIIDDDARVSSALQRVLCGRYLVDTVASAEDALGRLERDPSYAAIVCDVSMPGMSGVDFLERLPRMGKGLERRVLLITGAVREDSALERIRALGAPVLMKPFAGNELCAALGQLTSER